MRLRFLFVWFVILFPSFEDSAFAADAEHTFALKCRDGFNLDGTFRLPDKATAKTVKRALILLHGSGPQSMDVDLTAVTKNRKKNLLFKEIAEVLSSAGFTVVRYHKRSYQVRLKVIENRKFVKSKEYQTFAKNPLKFFVEDAHDCVKWAVKQFPNAAIYLLGHSQGTYVALQVARQEPKVKGVALIGFHLTSLDMLLFEQTVYRPLRLFHALDIDRNGILEEKELKADKKTAALLRSQMKIIDLDGDGKLALVEFKAANYSNLALRDLAGPFRKQEAAYPRPAEILKTAKFKVAFFQGLLDNQTPAYYTKAIELLAKHVSKKPSFRFHYFPGLGHALDKRKNYNDLQFDTIDEKAKQTLAKELKAFFE